MKLTLYFFEGCPYCGVVDRVIERLKVPNIEYRDILKHPQFRDELIRMNGIRQVPCLVVDGKPMLESQEIVKFLEENFG